MEAYKNSLLENITGINYQVIKALTEGINKRYIGEEQASFKEFKRNVIGRVSKKDLRLFNKTFNQLVENGVIVEHHRGKYSYNTNLDEVENIFLQEYLRVAIYDGKVTEPIV